MAETLSFDLLVNDKGSKDFGRFSANVKRASNELELAQVNVAKATDKAAVATEKFGKDSVQAREAVARLAKAELQADAASGKLSKAQYDLAKAAKDSADEVDKAAHKYDKLKEVAGVAAAGAAAALGKGFVDSLQIDAGRAKLAAQLGLTGKDAEAAGRMAGEIYGANFGESTEQVNEALRIVRQQFQTLGNTAPGDIKKTTEAALTLSTVFGVDVAESARAAGQLVRTGLVANSKEAFDTLAKGFQSGLNASDDFIETMNEYGGQFQKLGLSGKDALNLISQGLKAGARDTDYVADAFKEFSIRAIDGTSKTVDGFESLGLSAEKTAAAIASGGPAARTATQQVLDGLRAIDDPIERERIGVELFGTKWEDLGQQVFQSLSLTKDSIGSTSGAIDQMTNTIGSTGSAKVEKFTRAVEQTLQRGAQMPGVIGAAAASVTAFGPSALQAAGSVGQLVTGFKSLNLQGKNLKGMAVSIGAVTAALVAMQIAGQAFAKDASVGPETATKALDEYQRTGKSASDVTKNLAQDIRTLQDDAANKFAKSMESLSLGLGSAHEGSFKQAAERIRSIDAALAQQVTSGNADKAAAQWKELERIAKENGVALDELKAGFPQYQNAIDGVSNSQRGAADATKQTNMTVAEQAAAFQKATTAAVEHANALLGLRGDETSYWAAVDASTAALKANGKTLDVTTEKGRANRTALDAQARASLAYTQSMIEQKRPAAEVNAQIARSEAALIKAAIAFGMTDSEAKVYARDILRIPPQAVTRVIFDDVMARRRIDTFAGRIGWLNGKSVNIPVYIGNANQREGRTARSGGGAIPGAPSNVDTVPAMLAPGEFVVNAYSTARNRPLLEAINSNRRGYAAGGMVSAAPVASGTTVLTLRSDGGAYGDFLLGEIRKLARVNGGNVQLAFGQN